MSLVSSTESQQYLASGPVFFAVGIDFGSVLTFLQSVFNMVKGMLPCIATIGEETSVEVVMEADSNEEGMGMGQEYDIESVDVDKHHEVVMGRCHTIIEIMI